MKGTTFEQQGNRQAIPSNPADHNLPDLLHCPGARDAPCHLSIHYLSSTLPPLDRKLLLLTYKCLCT